MPKRNATCAVIGAGDFIGAEICKRFAAEGFTVFAGRRNGEKLEPLKAEIESAGGAFFGRSLDARKEEETVAFLNDADQHAPLEVCIFNVGANVNFPILETTDRVFRKVWEMACWAGFVAGRESARLMLPRGGGNIFFTGATASLRGGSGYAAFASAKFGLRGVAQAMARELGPNNIHVAHLIIDSGVDTAWVRQRTEQRLGKDALDANPDLLMPPGPSRWKSARSGKSGRIPTRHCEEHLRRSNPVLAFFFETGLLRVGNRVVRRGLRPYMHGHDDPRSLSSLRECYCARRGGGGALCRPVARNDDCTN